MSVRSHCWNHPFPLILHLYASSYHKSWRSKRHHHSRCGSHWWRIVSRPRKTKDVEFRWRLTRYHLAAMIDAAGYSTEKQYEALPFHYHWIVSKQPPRHNERYNAQESFWWGSTGIFRCLDLAQRPSLVAVLCPMSLVACDGSPFEYSWKWNTTDGEPDIRYSCEAVNDALGTAADP